MGDDGSSAAPLLLLPRDVVPAAEVESRMQDAVAELATLSLRADEATWEADALEAESLDPDRPSIDPVATAEAVAAVQAEHAETLAARRRELEAALVEAELEAERVLVAARRDARMVVADASKRLHQAAGLPDPSSPPGHLETPPPTPMPAPTPAPEVGTARPQTVVDAAVGAGDAPVFLAYLVASAPGGGPAVDLPLGSGLVLPGPAAAMPPEVTTTPVSWYRRLLHLDVILPVVVAIIVLVILLAWVG